jgi:RNA polymerase sigma-70 factor (ECF subfamily)
MALQKGQFEQMVLEQMDRLYNLARWLVKNPDDAQDLVQETVLKALKARDQFQGGTTLTAWLYKILRNSFIDGYWRRQREPLDGGRGKSMSEPADEPEFLFHDAEMDRLRRFVAADINRALETLPEVWRTTIFLAEVEGLNWEEVAEVMGCPLGTVQSRIFRARRLLRQLLKDYAPERKSEG